MEVVLAVLRPKAGHAHQPYRPQLYEILLLDSKTPPGEKVKPAKYLPMFPTKAIDEEPRELVLTQLHNLTGIKGERALQIPWSQDVPGSNRESLSQFSVYCVPVSMNEKISKKFMEQAQNSPCFYPMEYPIDALNSGSIHFPSPTRTFLLHLESWMREKHQRSSTVECLFRSRAEFRVHLTVHNPVFIPSRISSEEDGSPGGKTAQFPPKIQLTANEALAKMLAIEKCDIVVMNPLFGSGLPYKTKVNAYEVNHHWPSIPDYGKISSPSAITPSGPRWKDKYPLHSSAAAGDNVQVNMLLKLGFSHSQLDSISWAPIHYAAWYGCIDVLETLIEAGCSPNLCDENMSTPLHIAAKKGNVQLLEKLMRCCDINVGARDKDGRQALDVSLTVADRTPRHDLIEQWLREADSRQNYIEVFLMDNTSKTLKLISGSKTTVDQINQQMMKEFNLSKKYTDVFTVWIGSKSLELQLKGEHEVVKQLDLWQKRSVHMLTEANPSEEEPFLSWRKNVKVSVQMEKELQHPKALDLLFHEAYHNYIHGLYPCKENKDVIPFATIIFALYHGGVSNVKTILSSLSSSQLKELIPNAVLRNKDTSHWVHKISKEYGNFKDIPPQQLKAEFLSACRKLAVYGSAFFTGNVLSQFHRSSTPQLQCYIGVNDIGIHIINIQSKQMLHSLDYEDLTWKLILEKSLLEVRIMKSESRESKNQRAPSARGVIEIRTRQAGLIDHLMQQLDPKHMIESNHLDYASR